MDSENHSFKQPSPSVDCRSYRIKLLHLILVVLGLACSSSAFAQNVFQETAFTLAIAETDENTALAALNTRLNGTLDSGAAAFSNFTFELDAQGQSKFTFVNQATSLDLQFKPNQELDHEATRRFTFNINAKKSDSAPDTVFANSLRVTIDVTNVDERPEVQAQYTGTDGRIFYIQKSPDIGFIPQIFAHQVFDDPDRTGGAMRFKPCADDFKVDEYRTPGDDTNFETRGQVAVDATEGATDSTLHCLPAPTQGAQPATHDVTRGGQVVNVTTIGSAIQITPVASDAPGVRRAVLTFHAWSSTPTLSGTTTITESILTWSRSCKDYGLCKNRCKQLASVCRWRARL